MPKTLIQSVVKQLESERARLENELRRVSAALTTFGKVFVQGSKRRPVATPKKRTISAAGRRRIAAAQKARWARIRAGKTGKK
jgi:16S rRNA G1207 methylase RsmC